MRIALTLAALPAVLASASFTFGSIARADDTFETRAQGATPVTQVDDLVWAVTAACDRVDDAQQRQCRQLRDRRARDFAGATLLVTGEPGAVQLGPWNAQKKSIPVTVSACVRCKGIEVERKTWTVAGTQRALHDTAKVFADEAAATAWRAMAANARLEMVVKLPDARDRAATKSTLALQVLAWRVIVPCDGSVVAASPGSGTVAPEPGGCPTAAAAPAPVKPTR